MKKGCLIALIVVPVLLTVTLGAVAYKLNSEFGLLEAQPISHEQYADATTRLRVLLRPEAMEGFILRHVPSDAVAIPGPYSIYDVIPMVLPREVALLSGSNYRTGKMDVRLFINERRGGPYIRHMANSANFLGELDFVRWVPNRMECPQRGAVAATGSIPIPYYEALEARILESWPNTPPPTPALLEGTHLLEAALDNRNGEVMGLIGVGSGMGGMDWMELFKDPQINMAMDILEKVTMARLTVNLLSDDEANIRIRVDASPEAQKKLVFILNMLVLPELKKTLRADYEIELDGELTSSDADNALFGDFRLKGFEKHVNALIQQQLGKE